MMTIITMIIIVCQSTRSRIKFASRASDGENKAEFGGGGAKGKSQWQRRELFHFHLAGKLFAGSFFTHMTSVDPFFCCEFGGFTVLLRKEKRVS